MLMHGRKWSSFAFDCTIFSLGKWKMQCNYALGLEKVIQLAMESSRVLITIDYASSRVQRTPCGD